MAMVEATEVADTAEATAEAATAEAATAEAATAEATEVVDTAEVIAVEDMPFRAMAAGVAEATRFPWFLLRGMAVVILVDMEVGMEAVILVAMEKDMGVPYLSLLQFT